MNIFCSHYENLEAWRTQDIRYNMSKNIEIDKCFGDASLKLLAKCGKVFLFAGDAF